MRNGTKIVAICENYGKKNLYIVKNTTKKHSFSLPTFVSNFECTPTHFYITIADQTPIHVISIQKKSCRENSVEEMPQTYTSAHALRG